MDIAIPTLEQVLAKVDDFLVRHQMAETRLGRDATGESSLIPTMRGGRYPSLKTLLKLDTFMAEQDGRATSDEATGSSGKSGDLTASALVCSFCDRPAADPATASCVDPDCALRPREVA